MKPLRLPYLTCGFTIDGLNLERFANMLVKSGIPLLSLERSGQRKLLCRAYLADMPAIRALIQEKGWKLSGEKPLQLAAALAFLRRRWGIPLGAVLMLALVITLYQFIWQVSIQGAGPYQGDIALFLAEEGYGPGRAKAQTDVSALEQKLHHRYPGVAWFRPYVHDITLMVDVTLGVTAPKLPPTSPGDLVAARDGVVLSVQVHAGTAAVKAGDLVQKGQVLIYGRERAADETQVPVAAQGIVKARCWTARQVSLPLFETHSAPTGRSAEIQQLCTPWLSYPSQPATPSYLACDVEVTLLPVVGSFFPVWLRREVRQEVALEYAPRLEAQVRQEAATAALRKLSEALAGDEIVDKWVDYCMIEGGNLQATATAEWISDLAAAPP